MRVRRLQQLVFRMQHDDDFSARVFGGDAMIRRELGLSDVEYAALCAPGQAAFSADRGRKRRHQFLRNVTSEFRASLGCGPRADGDRAWCEAFTRSEEFHRCVEGAARLPMAFADYATRVGQERGEAAFCAVVDLEASMTRARRTLALRPVAQRDQMVLAPWVQLCTLPAGAHALAAALLAQGGPPSGAVARVDEAKAETVLLIAAETTPRPGALRELRAEVLSPLVALFLRGAETPQSPTDWRDFAREHELEPSTVESVARDFVRERVLVGAGA